MSSDTFIDWLDLKQDHHFTHCMNQTGESFESFPVYHGGVYARGDEIVHQREGSNVYLLVAGKSDDPKACGFGFKRGRHLGSHSTSVALKSDGRFVQISGNVGRLDRSDNIWNYGLSDTVVLANSVIRGKGLGIPEFSRGCILKRDTISETDKRKGVSPWYWSGAVCNEVHVTRNYYAGSDGLASECMRDMGVRRLSRIAKNAFGLETLSFGMPTRKGQRLHKAVVVYRKGPEMLAHAKGEDAKRLVKESAEYQMAMDCGLVRVECKFGSHYLRENNQRYLGDMTMEKLVALFNRETAGLLLARPDQEARLVDAIPPKFRLSAISWIDGRDMSLMLSRTTFWRHRKALLEYGLDISEPRRVDGRPNAEEALQRMLNALPQHSLRPLACPDWYGLPEVQRVAA